MAIQAMSAVAELVYEKEKDLNVFATLDGTHEQASKIDNTNSVVIRPLEVCLQ